MLNQRHKSNVLYCTYVIIFLDFTAFCQKFGLDFASYSFLPPLGYTISMDLDVKLNVIFYKIFDNIPLLEFSDFNCSCLVYKIIGFTRTKY